MPGLGHGGQKLFLESALRGGYPELAICQKIWENRYSEIAAILPPNRLIGRERKIEGMIWRVEGFRPLISSGG